MKTCLILAAFAFVSASALAVGEVSKLKKELDEHIETCNKDFNLEADVIEKMKMHEMLPEDKNQKCFIACVMTKLEVIKDNKIVLEKIEEIHKVKYGPDMETVKKADEIAKMCMEKVPKDITDDCELAAEMITCCDHESKKAGLPKANV